LQVENRAIAHANSRIVLDSSADFQSDSESATSTDFKKQPIAKEDSKICYEKTSDSAVSLVKQSLHRWQKSL